MKIALHGYGKMGKAIEKVAIAEGHQIVAVIDSSRQDAIEGADVIIDFSHASALDRAVGLACEHKIDLVIGTTGWNERVDEVAKKIADGGAGAVYASNFSPGANVMFALARRAGELFARFPQYAAGLEERHHAQKKDAPSGTALKIASEVREGSDRALDLPSDSARDLPIAASRVGAEFGLHTLFFDSPDDVVEISHRARNRDGFARGAVFAAEKLRGRKGLLTFEELMFG